jgi:hypothetical protein
MMKVHSSCASSVLTNGASMLDLMFITKDFDVTSVSLNQYLRDTCLICHGELHEGMITI